MDEGAIWESVGADGFRRLTAAFYRLVREDELLAPTYPDAEWDQAEARLRGFLLFRFGGVMDYVNERGHPRLRMRHLPFVIGEPERDRWLALMSEAVGEAELPEEEAAALMAFFAQVAEFLRNH